MTDQEFEQKKRKPEDGVKEWSDSYWTPVKLHAVGAAEASIEGVSSFPVPVNSLTW